MYGFSGPAAKRVHNTDDEDKDVSTGEINDTENVKEEIRTPKATGQTIKVLPEKKINSFYLVPTILLLLVFILLAMLKKEHIAKNKRKIVSILQLIFMGLILLLFFSSMGLNPDSGAFHAALSHGSRASRCGAARATPASNTLVSHQRN